MQFGVMKDLKERIEALEKRQQVVDDNQEIPF
jgi:hypothetical protein